MPRASLDPTKFSSLGRIIFNEFLWKMTPPWSASKLAEKMDISPNAVLDWVYGRSKPRSEMIQRLYSVILENGFKHIAIDQLYEAADVEPPSTTPWRDLERYINREMRIPPEAREKLINTLHEAENEYHRQSA